MQGHHMVLIVDGSSKKVAHGLSEIGYLISFKVYAQLDSSQVSRNTSFLSHARTVF